MNVDDEAKKRNLVPSE